MRNISITDSMDTAVYQLQTNWMLWNLFITDLLHNEEYIHYRLDGYCGLSLQIGCCGIYRLQTRWNLLIYWLQSCWIMRNLSITDSLDTTESIDLLITDSLDTTESIDLLITDLLDTAKYIDYRLIGYCGVYQLQTNWMLWNLSITGSLDTVESIDLLITNLLDTTESVDYRLVGYYGIYWSIDNRLVGYCRIYRLQTHWILRNLSPVDNMASVESID